MASDRDTLASLLKETADRASSFQFHIGHYRGVAEQVLAAGWRPPARVVADGGEIEAIAVEWMRYIGYTAEQIVEAEGQSCADTCERVGDAWDCTDQDGDSLHPVADELAASVAMANVAMETIEARGWRPPAREITTAAEADALPVGTILAHPDCPDPEPCIWVRVCSAVEIEEDPAGGTRDDIHWTAWGDEYTRYDSEDLEGHADFGGRLLAVYVPTEDPACPHDSRSGDAGGRWRCDQCGADCGPNTYLTEEADRA